MTTWIGTWWTLDKAQRARKGTSDDIQAPTPDQAASESASGTVGTVQSSGFVVERRRTPRADSAARAAVTAAAEPWWARPIQRPRHV